MFSSISNYLWGEAEAGEREVGVAVPHSKEVETDWILVGGGEEAAAAGLSRREEKRLAREARRGAAGQTGAAQRHRLHSLMFSDCSTSKPPSNEGFHRPSAAWATNHQQYNQNLNIKTAGNRTLKQC